VCLYVYIYRYDNHRPSISLSLPHGPLDRLFPISRNITVLTGHAYTPFLRLRSTDTVFDRFPEISEKSGPFSERKPSYFNYITNGNSVANTGDGRGVQHRRPFSCENGRQPLFVPKPFPPTTTNILTPFTILLINVITIKRVWTPRFKYRSILDRPIPPSPPPTPHDGG